MFDSKKMFDLGFAFLNAGEVNFHEGVIKDRSYYQNVVGIVNLALSCELFIKCLLNMIGQKSHEHKLELLWVQYKNTCQDVASSIEDKVMSNLVTDFSFEKMLSDDSNIFCNYRYLYEPDRLNKIRDNPIRPQFLRAFAYELYSYLRNE